MKNIILTVGLMLLSITLNAQYNPLVFAPTFSESPIDISIDSSVTIGFTIGNSGIAPLDRWETRPMRFVLSYNKMEVANVNDPASCVIGNTWFDVVYIDSLRSFHFTQNTVIPGGFNGLQTINILSKVTEASTVDNKSNGFNINIQPPSYTNGINVQGDDYTNLFTYTIDNDPLPVELIRFEGSSNQCAIELLWETASEDNNDYFEVQRSYDATNWESIGKVSGHGNSNVPVEYSYVDELVANGQVYYRLKQVDYSGEVEYHKVVSVQPKACDSQSISISPNPASQVLNLIVNTKNSETLRANIVDVTGKIIKSIDQKLESTQQIDISSIPNGTYFLKIEGADQRQKETYPFVIVN